MDRKPETQFARSGDVAIAYQVVGDGPIDVVVVPGFMSHVELNWDYVFVSTFLERLATVSRLVVLDKRGSGLSDRSLGAGTLDEAMDDIRVVMDAAGIERASIVGISNGGPLATMFAATCPERVEALVLAISGCPGSEPVDPALEEVLTLVGAAWTTGLVVNAIVQHAPDPDEAVDQLARFERYCCTPAVAVELLRRSIESDLTPFLPFVRVPTLVVSGSDDPVVPLTQGIYLAEHIVGARHVIVDADYHGSWLPTDYDEALRHIVAFLTGEPDEASERSDRILSTVLYTDIVASTGTAADLGDASWRAIIDRYEDLCRREVERRGGALVKHTGDGMLAHFDRPGRAVSCALIVNDQVGALGLRTRSGVHTGEVEVRGRDLGGIATTIAARVMDAASPSEVLVSRTVKDLTIGGPFEYVDRGEHLLKGVPGSWDLYAVAR